MTATAPDRKPRGIPAIQAAARAWRDAEIGLDGMRARMAEAERAPHVLVGYGPAQASDAHGEDPS